MRAIEHFDAEPYRRLVVDTAVASGALTSPWWLHLIEDSAHGVVLYGGGGLVLIRLALAVWDVRDRIKRRAAVPDRDI